MIEKEKANESFLRCLPLWNRILWKMERNIDLTRQMLTAIPRVLHLSDTRVCNPFVSSSCVVTLYQQWFIKLICFKFYFRSCCLFVRSIVRKCPFFSLKSDKWTCLVMMVWSMRKTWELPTGPWHLSSRPGPSRGLLIALSSIFLILVLLHYK